MMWLAAVSWGQTPVAPLDVVGTSYRLPAVEPADALRTFQIQPGFELQLVAHEPQVSDPIDACFDASGRLYVAEMHGYPYSEEVREQQPLPLGKKDACMVRRLEDRDGDGVFETSTVYAAGISWVTSVACWEDGLFVLAPSKLYFYRDTNGDGVADEQEVVLEGFSRANVQGVANNLKWGLDGRLYLSGGTNGGELTQRGQPIGSLRGRDLAIHPRTRQVEFITGGRQFGSSFDDWGNRFVCSNSDHIQQVLYPLQALEKGTISLAGSPIISIGKEGPAAQVFRRSPAEPWRIERTARRAADPAFRSRLPESELVPTGFFTSATGVTIYRGHAYLAEYHGQAFIGDVGGNLIHRKQLTREGARWLATRADTDVEFISSTDTWFRPANFVNGPDGCLYILDMYRETIEHPASIPEDIKAKVDLESGYDRGRIYRIAPTGWKRPEQEDLAVKPSTELVELLAHPNAWHRETAARLLLERQDRTIADPLRTVLYNSPVAVGRLQALYALRFLGLLKEPDLARALDDPEPQLVAHAVQLCQPFLTTPETTLRKHLLRVAAHPDQLVRFQLGLMLTGVPVKHRVQLWQALAAAPGNSPDVEQALLLALPPEAVPIARELLSAPQPSGLLRPVLNYLARQADPATLRNLLQGVFAIPDQARLNQCLADMAQGLKTRKLSLTELVAMDASLSASWNERCLTAQQRVVQSSEPLRARLAGLELLAYAPPEIALVGYRSIWEQPEQGELVAAAARSAAQHQEPAVLEAVAEHAISSTPAVRPLLLSALLSMPRGAERVVSLLEAEQVTANDLLPAEREQLRQHPDAGLRARVAALAGFMVNADRRAVIDSYAAATELPGDPARGLPLYQKHCAACHRLGELGHLVGPEFKSVKNKSAEDLLVAILDPSREAQPSYVGYTVLLTDGRVLTGIIASETTNTLTLRQAEGKDLVLPRSEIEALKSTGQSLMPAGLEKVLTPADLADLIALIRE
jgi:putative membrane-bound dehydrogenase-like protein